MCADNMGWDGIDCGFGNLFIYPFYIMAKEWRLMLGLGFVLAIWSFMFSPPSRPLNNFNKF